MVLLQLLCSNFQLNEGDFYSLKIISSFPNDEILSLEKVKRPEIVVIPYSKRYKTILYKYFEITSVKMDENIDIFNAKVNFKIEIDINKRLLVITLMLFYHKF